MSSKEKLNKHHPQPKGHDSIDNCWVKLKNIPFLLKAKPKRIDHPYPDVYVIFIFLIFIWYYLEHE